MNKEHSQNSLDHTEEDSDEDQIHKLNIMVDQHSRSSDQRPDQKALRKSLKKSTSLYQSINKSKWVLLFLLFLCDQAIIMVS